MPVTLESLSQQLQQGLTTSVQLVERALQASTQPVAEHLFISTAKEAAREAARQHDQSRASGAPVSQWAGIPITIKDLFDIEGQVTTAGSRVLAGGTPAATTAPAIKRLIDAGFIVLGKVNMTEFAYSGLGLNPHYGTPVNPCGGESRRIPGGSSSGGGVSVASGLTCASIGTDTGGSVRIPASLCGLTGFKPPAGVIPNEGVVPLSQSLDCVGPLANSVACCRTLASLMSDGAISSNPIVNVDAVDNLRLLVPCDGAYAGSSLWSDMDSSVNGRFHQALQRCADAGVTITYEVTPLFDELLHSGIQGVIAGFESSRWHHSLMQERANEYDPRVLQRLQGGLSITQEQYSKALRVRDVFLQRFAQLMENFDAVVWPTTAIGAPLFTEFSTDENYAHLNQLMLRNTSVGNTLDAAAVSLPMPMPSSQPASTGPEAGVDLPAGFMLLQIRTRTDSLLAVAEQLERIICV